MKLNNIKNNYYKIINITFVIFSVISFIVPFIILKTANSQDAVSFNSILGYLRFLLNTDNGAILEIAIHNWGIAAMVFMVSLYSYGFLGIIPLASAFFLTSVVIQVSPNLPSVIFICLEALGMVIAVFSSTYIFNRRKIEKITLLKFYLYSLCVLAVLFLVYFVAAYIEGGILQGLLNSINNK